MSEPDNRTEIHDIDGPVAVDGGKALDLRGSQGAIIEPSGPVTQTFVQKIGQVLIGDLDADRARRNRENRAAMLQKVRHAWIEGVLEQSLYQVARIDLGLEEQPDAVPHPWDMIVQEQGRPPRDLVPGTRMGEVFDQLGGALLLLGAPGTGKTTLLLELADELLDRAHREAGHRIPVVFNLSSWAVKRKPLVEWLVDELNERYDVPRKMGQAWVDADAILPLLDGLDEVAQEQRENCAEAINTFRGDHGLTPLVVCSRVEEYASLTARLRLSGAILIQPMTREQVDAYLARAGQPLAGMRDALQADETLYELFDTPLMLSIAALAYQDASAQAMQTVGPAEERRQHLFAAYVDAMFRRRGKEHPYARPQTVRWLSWLARQMVDHEQSVFYLEWMQPDWLPRRGQQRLVTWGVSVAIVLFFSLLFGRFFGLLFGLFFGLFLSLLFGLFLGPERRAGSILPVEALSWSWPKARRGLVARLFGGLFGGLVSELVGRLFGRLVLGLVDRLVDQPDDWQVFGLIFGLIFWLVHWLVGWLFGGLVGWLFGGLVGWLSVRTRANQGIHRSARNGLVGGLFGGLFAWLFTWLVGGLFTWLVGGLFGGLVGGLVVGLVGGLSVGSLGVRTRPNQGMRRSAQNGFVFGLIVGLVVGLVFGLGNGLAFGLGNGLVVGLGSGLVGGLVVGLWFGGRAYLQHFVLRLLLRRNDFAPPNYVRFLDYAAERILLRKVGGGYIFVHRMLMEHLSEQWNDVNCQKITDGGIEWAKKQR